MRRWKQSLGFAAMAAGLIGLFGFVVVTRGPMAPLPVTVAKAERGSLQPQVTGIAVVEARRSYAIGPTQAGRVAAIEVDMGDRVERGQLLGRMDPVDVDARLAAARQARERAVHAVVAAEAQLAEARARERAAGATSKRYQELRTQGFVSTDVADLRRHEGDAAIAAVQAAEAGLRSAREEVTRFEQEAQAAAELRRNLDLMSPVAGIVTTRAAEPGTTVVAGQAVLRLVDPASLWLRARIDQGRAGAVRVGQPVEIRLRSRPDRPLAGRVARLEINADEVTEERLVNILFDEPPETWSLGELAEVTIRVDPVRDAVHVPSAAVKRVGGRTGVWRIAEDGLARFTPAQAGTVTLDGRTQVDGFAAGDEVIVHTPEPLSAGRRVRVVPSLSPG